MSDDLRKGLRYLRGRVLAAHACGDGFTAQHACRIAAQTICRHQLSSVSTAGVTLADVRWLFPLYLYWVPTHDLILDSDGNLKLKQFLDCIPPTDADSSDRALISALFQGVSRPLDPLPVGELIALPGDWIKSRSSDPEDLVAFSLAVEFAWYVDPEEGAWRELVERWLQQCQSSSPLVSALTSVRDRLQLQLDLCLGSIAGPSTQDVIGLPTIAACWRAFLDCDWTRLDELIRQMTVATRVEASEYIPLFSLIHMSRMFRPRGDDQGISLSRRLYGMSRQPLQLFSEYRSDEYSRLALAVQLLPNPASAVHEQWKRFVIAKLNQLAALRTWDLGRWHQSVRQEREAHLEAARFGNPLHAMYGLSSSVLALAPLDPRRHVHLASAFPLLDGLEPAKLAEFVGWLVRRRPVEWRGANEVLALLSDAIPQDMLPDVARWSVRLSTTDKQLFGWSITYLEFWSSVLPFADDPGTLADILRPAVEQEAIQPQAPEVLSELLMTYLATARPEAARVLARGLISTPEASVAPAESRRWWILFLAASERRELLAECGEWLRARVGTNPHCTHLLSRLEAATDLDAPMDDPNFRDWIRQQLFDFCDRIFPKQGSYQRCQVPFAPSVIRLVTWDSEEENLLQRLEQSVDATEPLLVNKGPILEAARELISTLPFASATRLASASLRWLRTGVPGYDLASHSPHSAIHALMGDPNEILGHVLALSAAALNRAPDYIEKSLAEWVLQRGLQQPVFALDGVFKLAVALALRDASNAIGLLGIAEAAIALSMESRPVGCVSAFRSLIETGEAVSFVTQGGHTSPILGHLFNMWERRLQTLAAHHRAAVRRSVAMALTSWDALSATIKDIVLPATLRQTLTTLTKDARASVRRAAQSLTP